mgnify:FL=1
MTNLFNRNPEYTEFIQNFPEYKKTGILDKLRKTDFSRLDKNKHIYLDYTGGNIYAKRLVDQHRDLLVDGVFGNPHSTNPTSLLSTQLVDVARSNVLNYFNASEDYFCIFTPNASGALKIVGECYPFDEKSIYLLSTDNHNSVNGIREFAKKKGADFKYTTLDKETLYFNEKELNDNLESYPNKTNKLFAFPAQSNVSGIKHPLKYIDHAKAQGWDVLLDTAAFVPSDKLDLTEVQPDFAVVSFYKLFGYPTGLGCLLMKKSIFNKMKKPWYAGGNISLSAASYDGHYLMPNHERFEDGTIDYLGIPAITHGLKLIEEIGILTIKKRVRSLISWLLSNLSTLNHDNKQPLIKIFGSQDIGRRGSTLVMNFYDVCGTLYSFSDIEQAANQQNISIRTGCFCNPGLDEINNNITIEELEEYFTGRETGDFFEMIEFMGKLRGSIRISLGIVSNFKDVQSFYNFSKKFLNKKID